MGYEGKKEESIGFINECDEQTEADIINESEVNEDKINEDKINENEKAISTDVVIECEANEDETNENEKAVSTDVVIECEVNEDETNESEKKVSIDIVRESEANTDEENKCVIEEKLSLEDINIITEEYKRVFLIDYENVKISGLNGISKLSENDEVYIFYSEKSDSMTFGLHRRIMQAKVKIFYYKVQVGYQNSLDFQLSSFLGYIIGKNECKEVSKIDYYIVSKDKGYLCLISYWSKKKVSVNVVSDITGRVRISEVLDKDKTTETKESTCNNDINKQLKSVVRDAGEMQMIKECISIYKTKSSIHNALQQKLKDRERACEIYSIIKKYI